MPIQVVGPPILPEPIPSEPPPDPAPGFFDDSSQPGVLGPNAEGYLMWRCWCRTKLRSGSRMMPVAADDSQGFVACKPVKLHAATSKIEVRYLAMRRGAFPDLPDPRPQDSNLLLLACDDRTFVSTDGSGSGLVFVAKGRRLYGCILPVFGPVHGLLVATPPYTTLYRGNFNVPPNAFSQNIV